jgi:hypothetical protein
MKYKEILQLLREVKASNETQSYLDVVMDSLETERKESNIIIAGCFGALLGLILGIAYMLR